MSTPNSSADTATEQDASADDRSKSERLAEYLRQEAADGEAYIKAKHPSLVKRETA